MTKGRAPVSFASVLFLPGYYKEEGPGLHVLREHLRSGTVALNMLSLEEDKVNKQSCDAAMCVLTTLLVSSLARSG